MDPPSSLEHMFEETRDDGCLTGFLLEIHDTFEVGMIFGFVGWSSERDIDVFASDPLVEVIFDLKEELINRNNLNVIPKIKTYHCEHKSDGSHWKYVIFGKFRVYNTVIVLVLEPDLVDDGLYQGGTKYSCFQCGILSVNH
jgi:hypothetical protein